MASNKDDILKKLIQTVAPDKPPMDFTESVMKEIQAETQMEVVVNPALKALLRANALEMPPVDFTRTVMAQLTASDRKIVFDPIITMKAWFSFITVVLGVMIIIVFTGYAPQAPRGLSFYAVDIGNTFTAVFSLVKTIPSLYLMLFICIGALLLIDYFIKERFSNTGKEARALS